MLTAIVVNWNGQDYLPACLDALFAQDVAPDEVILVDNHSEDGSRYLVAEHYPQVKVVDTGFNGGPCHARNVGAAHARGERILFLDLSLIHI